MIKPSEASPLPTANDVAHSVMEATVPTVVLPTNRVQALTQKLFAWVARVEAVEAPNEKFRVLTLGGEALQGLRWTPGGYVDILCGGWSHPSYTPLEFDAAAGRTRILAYLQAGGPGTRWASAARVGDACYVHGPRAALDLTKLARPAIFFGDETAFGLAAALCATPAGKGGVDFLFELNTPSESLQVLEALELSRFSSCVRTGGNGHLPELETRMRALVAARQPAQFLLSGRAAAIRQMMKALRQAGFARSQFLVQAYWNSKD